jgi:hypothetical protein
MIKLFYLNYNDAHILYVYEKKFKTSPSTLALARAKNFGDTSISTV